MNDHRVNAVTVRGLVVTAIVTGPLLAIPRLLAPTILVVTPRDGTLGTRIPAALLLLGLRAMARRWIRELDSSRLAVSR